MAEFKPTMTKQEVSEAIRKHCLGFLKEKDATWDKLPELESIETIDKERFNDFLRFCNATVRSPHWEMLIKIIVRSQENACTMMAQNYDDTTFYRATINGVQLLDKMLLFFKKRFDSLGQIDNEVLDKDNAERYNLLSKDN